MLSTRREIYVSQCDSRLRSTTYISSVPTRASLDFSEKRSRWIFHRCDVSTLRLIAHADTVRRAEVGIAWRGRLIRACALRFDAGSRETFARHESTDTHAEQNHLSFSISLALINPPKTIRLSYKRLYRMKKIH